MRKKNDLKYPCWEGLQGWFCKIMFLIILGLLVVPPITEGKALPENIKKIVLNEIEFYETVTVKFLESESWLNGDKSLWGEGFLIPNGYFKKMEGRYVVSEKLKPYLKVEKNPYFWRFIISVGRRSIKSIDYMNNWQEGVTKFWSFKFTYHIDPILPGLPKLGPFQGNGIAAWHPASGKWEKYRGSHLSDDGHNEYEKWLKMARTREREKVEAEIVKIASEKYRDNGDGTITDMTTGLIWIQSPLIEGYMTWDKAVSACSSLMRGGLKGWRLPTRAELKTIIYEVSVKEILIDTHDNKYLGESSKRDEKEIWTSDDGNQGTTGIRGNVLWMEKWAWSYKYEWKSSITSHQYNHKVLCVRKGDNE